MTNRDNLALLLLMLLISMLLGCVVEENGGDTCHELWVDCPGTANDYMVANRASDLEQEVSGQMRYFSYYNCDTSRRTPILIIDAKCTVSYKY